METRAHYVVVGAVVLVLIASAFAFVLFLSQSRDGFDKYDIIFRERVSGLTVGAAVSFNGIQKGEVRDLTISPNDPSVVIARIEVDDDTPVKTDTKAELELVGFTGLAIIQLVGGSAEEELLKNVTRGIPRIEADSAGIAQLIAGSGEIIASANRLLSAENTESFTNILTSVETLTATLAGQEDEIAATIENTAKLTANLATATEKLSRTADNLDKLLATEAPATLEETQLLMAELRAAVAENREQIRIFTDQGLAQVGPAVAEARAMFRTLDQVLREIDRDPRGYLLGESTPRYEGEQP